MGWEYFVRRVGYRYCIMYILNLKVMIIVFDEKWFWTKCYFIIKIKYVIMITLTIKKSLYPKTSSRLLLSVYIQKENNKSLIIIKLFNVLHKQKNIYIQYVWYVLYIIVFYNTIFRKITHIYPIIIYNYVYSKSYTIHRI